MNGAESLVETLIANEVDTCFANPGTSEMHFVAALDRIPGIRCVLGLFEGVVTGAADGYGRMKDLPAATLLHCGPGLANGLANLHNAKRARSPIVNIVGDQATHHRVHDAPLTADTEGWARGVSGWTHTTTHSSLLGQDAARAVRAARSGPGQIATLILPADVSWNDGGDVGLPLPASPPPRIAASTVIRVADILRSGQRTVMVLGGRSLRARALEDAHAIAAQSGTSLIAECYNSRIERGIGRRNISRVAYGIDEAVASFSKATQVILVGAREPVAVFAYPNKPGRFIAPNAALSVLATPLEDMEEALAALREELRAPAAAAHPSGSPLTPATGAPTGQALTQSIAALLPDQSIVVEEGISVGRPLYPGTAGAAPHDWLQITGAAIGSAMPMAVGAAIASPGRRVVTIQGDGSAMYTVQALWTQARERLDITTVILANRKYAVLLHELKAVGATAGKTASDMLDLGRPDLDWVSMGKAMGVESARAGTMERFNELFQHANARPGPFLIELVL